MANNTNKLVKKCLKQGSEIKQRFWGRRAGFQGWKCITYHEIWFRDSMSRYQNYQSDKIWDLVVIFFSFELKFLCFRHFGFSFDFYFKRIKQVYSKLLAMFVTTRFISWATVALSSKENKNKTKQNETKKQTNKKLDFGDLAFSCFSVKER